MLSRKILKIGTLTMLLGSTLFAQGANCSNGVCFAIFDQPIENSMEEKSCDTCIANLEEPMVNTSTETFILSSPEVKNEILPLDVAEVEQEIHEIIKIEDIEEESIWEKSIFSDSEYYCDNNKKALFNLSSDEYECV